MASQGSAWLSGCEAQVRSFVISGDSAGQMHNAPRYPSSFRSPASPIHKQKQAAMPDIVGKLAAICG
jgi:hypothetical protein